MESPQLVRYSYLYQKNPNSRVFAPLAENYRKLGMLTDAFEVLKEGLKKHPDYTLGYIVLSKCHRDAGELSRAYDVLKFSSKIDADNFAYKELRASLAYKLDETQDALNLYMELKDLNPKGDYSGRILELNSRLNPRRATPASHIELSPVETTKLVSDWVHMDFSGTRANYSSDDEQALDDYSESELTSVTLMKLYMDQGYYAKALQSANTLLVSDPTNQEVRQMRDEIIQKKLFENEITQFEEDDELSDDHIEEDHRFSLETTSDETPKIQALRAELQKFQEKLNLKSAKVRLRSHA